VKLDEFRKRVFQEFGGDLNHATPANVRDFLDRMNLSEFKGRGTGTRLVLDDPSRNWEEVVKDTFARILRLPPEEAVPLLWIIAFELSYSIIEYQYGEVLEQLFQDWDHDP
jgi:hypothetical protein